jgi:hypothetical protein
MERLPVPSVNLGTGENGMHPDFKAIRRQLGNSLQLTLNCHYTHLTGS